MDLHLKRVKRGGYREDCARENGEPELQLHKRQRLFQKQAIVVESRPNIISSRRPGWFPGSARASARNQKSWDGCLSRMASPLSYVFGYMSRPPPLPVRRVLGACGSTSGTEYYLVVELVAFSR